MNPQMSIQQSSLKQWVAGLGAASILFHPSIDIPWVFGHFDDPAGGYSSITNVGLLIIGAVIGAVSADIFGRKRTLLAALIFVIPRLLLIIFENEGWAWIIEILIGFGSGITCTVVPLYISEIASTNNRGNLMMLQLLVYSIGQAAIVAIVLIYIHTGMSVTAFTIINGVLLVISVLFHGITLVMCPDTPHYLNSKKRYQEAAKSLAFFRGIDHAKIREEEVESSTNAQAVGKRSGCLGAICEIIELENRRSLAIIFSLIVIRWASGQYKNILILFQWANSYNDTKHMLILLGTFGIIVVFAVFILFTISHLRSKVALLLVTFGSFIAAMIGIAIFRFYPAVISVPLYIQHFCHLILVGVTLAYTGEFFSFNVRASAIAVIMSFEVLIRNVFLIAGKHIDSSSHIYACGGVFFIAFILVLIFFPKTKKLPSFEIAIETSTGGQYQL